MSLFHCCGSIFGKCLHAQSRSKLTAATPAGSAGVLRESAVMRYPPLAELAVGSTVLSAQ